LKKEIALGSVVIPDDFFNLFNQVSFYDDGRAHIVANIDAGFRQEVIDVITSKNGDGSVPLHVGGTYVQTSGPRMETKAEIRVISQWGEVVRGVSALLLLPAAAARLLDLPPTPLVRALTRSLPSTCARTVGGDDCCPRGDAAVRAGHEVGDDLHGR
jgi:5'-methylthioadenosine phosphorylase